MEEKWITQLNRYFFGAEGVRKCIDILLSHIYTLVKNHKEDLKKYVIAIAEENEMKGVPLIGQGTLMQLLSEVCNKLNAKGLFYINNNRSKSQPLAPAVNIVYSKLKKGEPVELASEDGKVKITAQSVNEFLEKILQFLM
jgi:exonuclease VII large subunit